MFKKIVFVSFALFVASSLCAQEKNNTDTSSSLMENNGVVDAYQLKNLMKFKFESDGSVTPYFLSYSNLKYLIAMTDQLLIC
jgi:hypothetical protein